MGKREMESIEKRLVTGVWEDKIQNIELTLEQDSPFSRSFKLIQDAIEKAKSVLLEDREFKSQ